MKNPNRLACALQLVRYNMQVEGKLSLFDVVLGPVCLQVCQSVRQVPMGEMLPTLSL